MWCVHDWLPDPQAFPQGLDGVQTNLPWLLYAPFFCANSTFVKEDREGMLVSAGGYVVWRKPRQGYPSGIEFTLRNTAPLCHPARAVLLQVGSQLGNPAIYADVSVRLKTIYAIVVPLYYAGMQCQLQRSRSCFTRSFLLCIQAKGWRATKSIS